MKESRVVDGRTKQDIVVVGAGMAGLVAAIEAATTGAKVTVLDKLEPALGPSVRAIIPGGIGNDTARSGGGGLARFSPETLLPKLHGHSTHGGDYIKSDTVTTEEIIEKLLSRHMEMSWGKVDPIVTKTYLERVFNDCKWFRDSLGAPYKGRGIRGRGPGLIAFMYKAAEARGINIIFKTKAIKLLTDNKGTVTGVRVRSSKGVTDLQAKAVILATGSFQGNQEMMLKYVGPEITYGTVLTGCSSNTGDGHLMAVDIGAQMVNLTVCHVRTTDKFLGIGPSRHLLNIYPMGIFINRHCKRFLDEGTADSDMIGNAIILQPVHKAALIFDEKARAKYPSEYQTYPKKEEVIKVAGTIEELATKIEVSPEELKKGIEEFNDAVKDGKALELSVPKTEEAYKIDTPPFYGFYPVLPGLNHPLGGVRINTKAQVLDRDGDPIPGLYAAGSILNWCFGKPYEVAGVKTYIGSYHAGASSGLATALVFGRIAGKSASEKAFRFNRSPD
jgi:succinate dehydrogenase/fumarate reductase flavoprotein subunit